ncbi:MAG TPA: putative glycolipid-binding domain-containing protein [Thermoplasmata archaeon]
MNRYRYESLDSGFTADIDGDDAGLVAEYPGLWRRTP